MKLCSPWISNNYNTFYTIDVARNQEIVAFYGPFSGENYRIGFVVFGGVTQDRKAIRRDTDSLASAKAQAEKTLKESGYKMLSEAAWNLK